MQETYPIRKAMGHAPPFPADDAWYFITICAEERGGSPFVGRADAILDAARHYHRIGKWFAALFLVMPDHLHAILHFPPADELVPAGRAVSPLPVDEPVPAGRAVSPLPVDEPVPAGRAVSPLTAAINPTTNSTLPCDCGGEGTRRPTKPTHEQCRPVGMAKTIADWKHYLTRTAGLAFQRDFFDVRIRDDAHYAEKFKYVCANPVRKGLCAVPRDWPHVIAFDRETGEERAHR